MLFDAGNVDELTAALDRLMSSPGLRKQMGAKARKRVVDEFSLSRHNAGLLNIYQSLLGA